MTERSARAVRCCAGALFSHGRIGGDDKSIGHLHKIQVAVCHAILTLMTI